jgi:hypothetical protein
VALIPPFFLDCVVAIGQRTASGVRWTASGFLYGQFQGPGPVEGQSYYRTYIVTNRHVLRDAENIMVRFNRLADEPAQALDIDLSQGPNGQPVWFAHPNPDVDVAIMPINVELLREHGFQAEYFHGDAHAASRERMRDLGVSEGDNAFVLGFPMELAGEPRNYVVVRSGTVARVRDCLQGVTDSFLIDTPVFPGNSGGPVVVGPELVAIEGTRPVTAAYVIGVVAAYLPYTDHAVSAQTGRVRVVFEENSGLTVVYTVDQVEETIDTATASPSAAPSTPPEAAPSEVPPEGSTESSTATKPG